MTREEAIEILKSVRIWTTRDDAEEAFDMAIKSLEQNESAEEWYKLFVEKLEQEPILDKIRAEIHATAEMHEDGDYYLRDEWIDEIFDKYKAEKEEAK